MRKAILIPTIIIFGTILIRFAINFVTDSIKIKMLKVYRPPEVTVEKVKTLKIHKKFEASGRIEAQSQVDIISRVSGYLEKSYFEEGSYVKKGDTLFLIEADEYKNSADIASADVNRLQAELTFANKQLERAQELVKSDYIAKSRYDELKANRDSLFAQLNSAKSDLKNKNNQLPYTIIKSPRDGKIGTVDISVGNYVNSSTGPLTTINSTDPMYVTFSLSSVDYSFLSSIDKGNNKNRKVEIYPAGSSTKYEYNGIQNFYDNKIEPRSGTVRLRATIKNPNNKLIHGEYVKTVIYSNNEVSVNIIPIVSVTENQRGKFVYTLNSKNIPTQTFIKTDGQINNHWIVTEGLKNGDTIIVNGVMKVKPDKPVKITTQVQQ